MITPTQQIAWSIVSRQPIADLSPTSRQPVADQSQPISNQLAINRSPVADWSPMLRDSCRRPVADWSATEKYNFWSHSGCIGCSCFLVARQSPTGCSTCVTGALLHWHCGNLTIAPVPAKQPWWIWINTSCEFIMNDCITTTKQSTTKPCAYFMRYTICTVVIFSATKRTELNWNWWTVYASRCCDHTLQA